jgi:hypothetical protein
MVVLLCNPSTGETVIPATQEEEVGGSKSEVAQAKTHDLI